MKQLILFLLAAGCYAQSNVSQLTGFTAPFTTIPNGVLTNSSITINGNTVSLGSSTTITAAPTSGFTYYPAFTQVVDGSYAWANQQTASYSVGGNGIIYITVPQLTGDNLCAREKAVPNSGSTPWSVTVAVIGTMMATNNNSGVGIEVRDSVAGHVEAMQIEASATGFSGSPRAQNLQGTLTSWSHTVTNTIQTSLAGIVFLKVRNDGVNLTFSVSNDGVNFSVNTTRPVSGFANAPNKVGFFVQSENAAANTSMAVLSWVEGS